MVIDDKFGRHVERVSAEHTGGVDVLDRHLGGVELVLPPVRMAPVVIVVSVHPSDFVLLGLALHGGETAKQRGHQRDTEKLLGSVHHFLLAGVWRPVFVLRKARRIPKIPFMMAVCYRLFLTGANAEILDKKTAEPSKSCFSGHQRVRPWRLSKA